MTKSKLVFKSSPYLKKLDRVMGFDPTSHAPSSSFLFLDSMARATILISIIATPYILWLLFKLKRFGWLFSFILFVLVPFIIGFRFIENEILRVGLTYLPILTLAVFHYLLQQTYPNWKDPIFINKPGSDYK
tara:strand:- start:49969 stop:50364 length:396 start_codon:yes stop_codon:yes gene_type:complete